MKETGNSPGRRDAAGPARQDNAGPARLRPTTRFAAVPALAVAGAVSLAACSSGGGSSSTSASSNGPVKITVGCEPPKTQAAQRKFFVDDIAAFEKANPNVTVVGDDTNPCDDPNTVEPKQ